MITRYLPTFKQVEPSNLYGLTMGWVVAQSPVAYSVNGSTETYGVTTVTKNGYNFIENGVICSLDADGNIVNYASGKQAFLHYTEPLNTFIDREKDFAVECEKGETYLRLVALVPGSVFVTDNFSGVVTSTNKYAVATNGVLTIASSGAFAVKATTLANGADAIEATYIG